MTGNIQPAIAFGRTKVGRWSYCTAANVRFGQTDMSADCSGFVSRCLWEGGMGKGEFPMSSGDMAVWLVNHPDRRLDIASAKRTFGAVLVYGGFVNGPRGHVVFSLGDGLHTIESSGSKGVNYGNINRLNWSHAGLPPVSYGAVGPTPPPTITEDDGSTTMGTVWYDKNASMNTFYVDGGGRLIHVWGNTGQFWEDMNAEYLPNDKTTKYISEPIDVRERGGVLYVRARATDFRLIKWMFDGKNWGVT